MGGAVLGERLPESVGGRPLIELITTAIVVSNVTVTK